MNIYFLKMGETWECFIVDEKESKRENGSHGTAVVQLLCRVCLCDLMDGSMLGSFVLHYLLEFVQIHVH